MNEINKPKTTMAGYKITDFKELDQPIDRGILQPMIYEGYVDTKDLGYIHVLWNQYGRCANPIRTDCFINIDFL